jgi:hypothetical protein
MTTEYAFQNDSGLTVLEGTLSPDPATLLPAGGAYVTSGTTDPTTYVSPIVVNTTATTGGSFAWDGSAYVRISPALT